MKLFMAVWAFLSKFKALFTTGFFTLIPLVNVIATIGYTVGETKEIPRYYKRILERNLQEAYDSAFSHQTRECWTDLGAALITAMVFVIVSAFVNTYFIVNYVLATGTDQFILWTYIPTWVTAWTNYAMYAVVGATALAQIFRMFNAIYWSHREYDPRFMDPNDSSTKLRLKHRAEAKAKREGATA